MEILKIGDQAPPFSAVTPEGQIFKFSAGKVSPFWMIFYRFPRCPLCNLHLSAIKNRMEKYPGLPWRVVCIFPSPAEAFYKNISGRSFPKGATIISDPQKQVFDLYSVGKSWSGLVKPAVIKTLIEATINGFMQGNPGRNIDQMPADFLIKEDGRLARAYYGRHAADHLSLDLVQDFFSSQSASRARDQLARTY